MFIPDLIPAFGGGFFFIVFAQCFGVSEDGVDQLEDIRAGAPRFIQ